MRVTLQDRFEGGKQYDAQQKSQDTFLCPRCKTGIVNITYRNDASGKHPNTGLECDFCHAMYSINMV